MKETETRSYMHVIRTLMIAIVTGVAAALVVSLFGFCLDWMLMFVDSLGTRVWMAMPFAAAIFVGLMIM